MPSRTTRAQARARLDAIYTTLRDKLIPADDEVGLGEDKFILWEDQAGQIQRELCGAFLEERAALAAGACCGPGGCCPDCGSSRLYLIKSADDKVEVLTPYGPVVLYKQRCRCGDCDRTFSPSSARLGIANRGESVAQGPAGPWCRGAAEPYRTS